jgi:hypothetical protein
VKRQQYLFGSSVELARCTSFALGFHGARDQGLCSVNSSFHRQVFPAVDRHALAANAPLPIVSVGFIANWGVAAFAQPVWDSPSAPAITKPCKNFIESAPVPSSAAAPSTALIVTTAGGPNGASTPINQVRKLALILVD